MTILVLTTGGTIGAMPYKDLEHQPKIKTMPAKGQDFVRTALQKMPNFKTRCVSLEARDSNHVDAAYQQLILDAVKGAPESSVLITHGTDTILRTADFLQKKYATDPGIKNKTIILTGAVVALSCGVESEGPANLGFALRSLSNGMLQHGVYIVLSDYQDPDAKTGWAPRLYFYKPGQYEKSYDAEDNRRSRIRRLGS